jgi:hypothetical protein
MPNNGDTLPLGTEAQELAEKVREQIKFASWSPADEGNMEDIENASLDIIKFKEVLKVIAETECGLVYLPYSLDRQILTLKDGERKLPESWTWRRKYKVLRRLSSALFRTWRAQVPVYQQEGNAHSVRRHSCLLHILRWWSTNL